MFSQTSANFHDIYASLLASAYEARGLELHGATFELLNPTKNTVRSEKRNFKHQFALALFEWIWSGSDDPKRLVELNQNAANYEPDFRYRNTSYGPRLIKQLFRALAELRADPGTRRATILILEPDDQELLWPKATQQITTEYPCAISLTFYIRDEQLNLHVTMRSNNVTTTICYDVFVFTMLLMRVRQQFFPELVLGTYLHHMVSAHIVPTERKLALEILKELNPHVYANR